MGPMRTTAVAVAISALALAAPAAQEPQDVPPALRQLFEAGQYEPVLEAVGPDAAPALVYLAALAHQKLGRIEPLQALASRLSSRPPEDPWHFVGLSLDHLAGNRIDAAVESARTAAMMANAIPQAHVQLGMALARREAWRDAAVAFDRAGQLDPQDAYAFYYAGLSHYRAGRRDLMAVRFERFLKLAPDAPERPEVVQIMRTIRGR